MSSTCHLRYSITSHLFSSWWNCFLTRTNGANTWICETVSTCQTRLQHRWLLIELKHAHTGATMLQYIQHGCHNIGFSPPVYHGCKNTIAVTIDHLLLVFVLFSAGWQPVLRSISATNYDKVRTKRKGNDFKGLWCYLGHIIKVGGGSLFLLSLGKNSHNNLSAHCTLHLSLALYLDRDRHFSASHRSFQRVCVPAVVLHCTSQLQVTLLRADRLLK